MFINSLSFLAWVIYTNVFLINQSLDWLNVTEVLLRAI